MESERGTYHWKIRNIFSLFSKNFDETNLINSHLHTIYSRKYSDKFNGEYIVFLINGCHLTTCVHVHNLWSIYTRLIDDKDTELMASTFHVPCCSDTVLMAVTKRMLKRQYKDDKRCYSLTVCFSWNVSNTGSKQGALENPERFPNILHRSVQTEELQSDARNKEIEREQVGLLEDLSNDFGCFYENKTGTDCLLKVDETEFSVHRAVLSARSPVFAAMFYHDSSESRSGEVIIPDVDPSILSNVLYYMYTGKIRGLTADTAVPMYTVADKYSLLPLRNICLKFLIYHLAMENICEAANLAHKHAEEELQEKVVLFIGDKMEELQESEEWKEFLHDHGTLASRLLCSVVIANKKK